MSIECDTHRSHDQPKNSGQDQTSLLDQVKLAFQYMNRWEYEAETLYIAKMTGGSKAVKDLLIKSESNIQSGEVAQALYGDCYFEATLAGMANTETGRRLIANMIKVHEDSSFEVTFPGDLKHPVHVSVEEVCASGTGNKRLWANVIETAFLKYQHALKPKAVLCDDVPESGPIKRAKDAEMLLTGCNKENIRTEGLIPLRQDAAEEALKLMAQKKMIMVADSQADGCRNGIVNDHDYTVLDYNPGNKQVTLRNPWGCRFMMNLDDFCKNFINLSFVFEPV